MGRKLARGVGGVVPYIIEVFSLSYKYLSVLGALYPVI